MDAPSIRTDPTEYSARVERALRLFEERGADILRIDENLYRVPSCSGTGSYDVLYGGEREECPCPDYQYGHGRACKHLIAVGIMHAVRRSGIREVRTLQVAAGDLFKAAGRSQRSFAGRECSACFGGYITITVEDDGLEHDEAVPCRHCRPERR